MVRRAIQRIDRLAAIAVAISALIHAGSLTAQEPLSTQAREAAKHFQPADPQELASAKAELAAAIDQLDRFLRTGAAFKAAGWKKYLNWEELVAAAQQPGRPPGEQLQAMLAKLDGPNPGLRMTPFARVREALARYAAVPAPASDDKLKDEFTKRVESLAGQLEAYEKNSAAGDAALAIGNDIQWLAAHGQAAQLVSAIRRTYGRQNLFGHASERLIAVGIEDQIDRVTGVRDNILGTDVHGTARMVGSTQLSLNENPHVASMSIALGGSISSNTVGYNGPVTIYSTGLTSAAGRKVIEMTPEGLIGYYSQASCRTSTSINDICARCGLIERVAWKRAGQQKGQAEAIASSHAAARVAGQMDGEAGRLIAEQNARYREKLRDPLLKRGEFPEEMAFSSTADEARVRILQESPARIAAPNDPPEQAADQDLALRAHESSLINFAHGLLGGYELTDLRLEKLIKDDLQGELPDELRVTLPDGTLDSEKDPWSIIFDKNLPVRAKFNNGELWIAIRAEGFTRGEGPTPGKYKPALTELVEIAANYKIEKTDKGATLRRDGDVQVRFPARPNPEQITVRDSPIVTFIRRKFRSLFKEEFVGEGLALKGRWERAGKLQLQEIKSDAAWLTLGWKMPAAAEPQQVAMNLE